MSFPGYLKSVKLRGKPNGDSTAASEANWVAASVLEADHEDTQTRKDHDSPNQNASQPASEEDEILDERSNGPSKSLWVGNIPPRTTSSELRALFNKFGIIVSTRVATKYAFVNFETIKSGIAAFKQCHDRDIFGTGTSTITIRFTDSLAEAKYAKEALRERQSSMITQAKAAQKQYFQSLDSSTKTSATKSPVETEWPNGRPPSGPKSQRREVSPPSLRRGDSYRPAELSRRDSYRSDEHGRLDREEHNRGRAYRRDSSQHYSPVYSTSYSRSLGRSGSSIASPWRDRDCGDESPMAWWERKRSDAQSCDLTRTQYLTEAGSDRGESINSVVHIDNEKSTPQGSSPKDTPCDEAGEKNDKSMKDSQGADPPPRLSLRPLDHEQHVRDIPLCEVAGDDSPPLAQAEIGLSSLIPNIQLNQYYQSPSLRPIERLRIENESIRGSSVPSDSATSTSKTSSKRRKCYDCTKAASELSPLVSCSKCTRRYHSGCGDPKPSSFLNKSKFACGRCQQKLEMETTSASTIAAIETKPLAKLNGKAHLVSPPLSLIHDGNESANLSPRDELLHVLSDEHRLESFFPKHTEDADIPVGSISSQTVHKLQDSTKPDVSADAQAVQGRMKQPTTISARTKTLPHDGALQKKNRYKAVTCKWWASGNCTQPEEGCYYTHGHTAISFPDKKHVNKSWTCHSWLHGKCAMSELECLHAHTDTGLHIWKDGRPSFKHVTCFWWSKGGCKWNFEFCKFAHEDTGLYSLDPAEIWQGGSKFTTTHPSGVSIQPAEHHRRTALSTSSDNKQQLSNELTFHDTQLENECFSLDQDTWVHTTGPKPSLTINTSTNSSISEHQSCLNNNRPFPTTIGAPPQTPNEESPNKTTPQEFRVPTTEFRSFPKIPSLPTLGMEECTQPEHRSHDYIGAPNNISAPASLAQATYEGQLTTKTYDNRLGGVNDALTEPDRRLPKVTRDQVPVAVGIEALEKDDNGASRDPHLQRQGQLIDSSAGSGRNRDILFNEDLQPSLKDRHYIRTPTCTDFSAVDDNLRRGVKKCLKCHKIVFGTNLCRICNSIKDDSGAQNPSNHLEQLNSTDSDVERELITVSDAADVLLEDLGSAPNAAAPSFAPPPASKNPLKRSTSGSNMFLKNKRPKSSMLFSSSGSIRPDAYRRDSVGRRPQSTPTKVDNRQGSKPTIDDLINEERAKNNKERGNYTLDVTSVQSPISEVEKETEAPDNPREQLDPLGSSSPATKRNRILSKPSNDGSYEPMTTDLFSTPQQSPIKNRLGLTESFTYSSAASSSADEVMEMSRPPECLAHGTSDWRRTKSPQTQRDTVKATVVDGAMPPQKLLCRPTISNESTVRIPPVEQKKPALLRRLSSRDVGASSGKIIWASPMTCTSCQRSHKKCLHDKCGSLSALKCREYVLSRNGRPDAGRSRHEWSTILEISELEPETDDDSSDNEASDSSEEQVSSESEDDFTTAMGDDEMILDDQAHEHEALLQKFKRPSSNVGQISPRRKPPTSVETFFVNNQSKSWTIADENINIEKLKKKGVMFESDSDDKDYLSDDNEAPLRHEKPFDPLRVSLKISKNLFEIAPELEHNDLKQEIGIRGTIQPRPSRKQQWAELQNRQLQERRERFGNPHWEVNRMHKDVMVTAFVERVVPPNNTDDKFAVGSVQTREEEISFNDFLGAPKIPEICLMHDRERLAFQDGQRERDRTFCRTGRGLGKKTTDDEKWLVRTK